jgi:hypothetical protein
MTINCVFHGKCIERAVFREWCRYPKKTFDEIADQLELSAPDLTALALIGVWPLTFDELKRRNDERLSRLAPQDERLRKFLEAPAPLDEG